jgi:hypothetical protein
VNSNPHVGLDLISTFRHTYALTPTVSAIRVFRPAAGFLGDFACGRELASRRPEVRRTDPNLDRRPNVKMRKLALEATCIILFGVLTLGSSKTALAQTAAAPKNLRVTGVTDWTVDLTVDPYPHQFTMYLTLGIENRIEVYAVDEAGNRSAPATMTIDLRTP